MRISQWLSEQFGRLSARERGVVLAGATVSILALFIVYVAVPYARQWVEREARIEAKTEQVARLQGLVESEAPLREAAARLEERRAGDQRRLLTGTTPALAASTLQTLLRNYAERSRVSLERVDVSRTFAADELGLIEVPVQLSARGDVYGLLDFLFYVQSGEKLLVIDQLQVNTGYLGARDSDLLAWNVSLHGLYLRGEASG